MNHNRPVAPHLTALRPHQWVKNVFVLAPLVFARVLDQPEYAWRGAVAFVAFCCVASAVYLFNDYRDREKDRLHPIKRNRPIASGKVSTGSAAIMAAVLIAIAFGLSTLLPRPFLWVLGSYLALNTAYTLWLKQLVILDVMSVAFCYLLRVQAGAAAIEVEVSNWLLLCTGALALFLAFSKRRHELMLMAEKSGSREVLSHYGATFLDQMINVVTTSSLLGYVLYTVDETTVLKFGTDRLVLTTPFVLFGIFRYLYLIYQKTSDRNPTEALVKDLPFVINMVLWAVAVLAILYH